MDSLRKWFYKPRRDDKSYLAQFFYADEALNLVAAELDSFDGRKDPERCTTLVNHLRQCQDKVLTICNRIMDEMIPNERADRDFRVKFPDDVMQDNLAGQLWFGAECLAAGSSIMNREVESGTMRPLAKALTKALESVRGLLREAALRGTTGMLMAAQCHPNHHHHQQMMIYDDQTERLVESLKMFDRLLADFELAYVSAMVPVKTVHEYEIQQCVIVLFSETLDRALKMGVLSQEMVDQYDPALMFTIPRLAIVAGLLIYPHGPLSLSTPHSMSDMFRPFRTLLMKIRELLWTLSEGELLMLEKMLCSSDETFSQETHQISSKSEDNDEVRWSKGDDEEAEEEGRKWRGEGSWKLCVIPCQCDERVSGGVGVEGEGENQSSLDYQHNWQALSRTAPPIDIHSANQTGECLVSSFSSSCSSCQSTVSAISNSVSSDTSSYNSDYKDDKEVELAVKAAQLTNSHEARAKFRSSGDLVHRLFVCISGVADQLQTNFAGDLRNILKAVFLIHASDKSEYDISDDPNTGECCERGEEAVVWGEREVVAAPEWVPDQAAPLCMACHATFTMVRRRHHCRNCGKVFCARCSSNSVPLPRYGHAKPVRVCNRCFIYQVTPFTIDDNIQTAN